MTFEEKRDTVDEARSKSLEVDDRFKELLGSGLSTVGAYNVAYAELEAKKPTQEPVAAPKKSAPVAKKTTTTTKVEKSNEQPSKS